MRKQEAKNLNQETVLHEQLALHRLRNIRPPDEPPEPHVGWAKLVLRATLIVIASVFGQVELVQNVEPGKPPKRRHEWDTKLRDPQQRLF